MTDQEDPQGTASKTTSKREAKYVDLDMDQEFDKQPLQDLHGLAYKAAIKDACIKLKDKDGKVELDDYDESWLRRVTDPVNVLGQYGTGVQLYFELHYLMAICFGIMFALNFPSLVWNLMGSMMNDMDPTGSQSSFYKRMAKPMIANLGTCVNCTMDQLYSRPLTSTSSVKVSDVTLAIAWLDFSGIMVYCIFLAWFRLYWLPRTVAAADTANTTGSDFTIHVTYLPRHLEEYENGQKVYENGVPKRDLAAQLKYAGYLKKHFQKVFQIAKNCYPNDGNLQSAEEDRVCEVALVREFDGHLRAFMEQGALLQEYKNEMAGHRRFKETEVTEGCCRPTNKSEGHLTRAQKLREKIDEIEVALGAEQNALTEYQREVCGAFVMFKNEGCKNVILNMYRNSKTFFGLVFQDEDLRFFGHRIRVEEACEPTDLFWENLDYSKSKHKFRRAIVVFIGVLMIVGIALWKTFLMSYNTPIDSSVTAAPLWVVTSGSYANCTQICPNPQTASDPFLSVPNGPISAIISGGKGYIWQSTAGSSPPWSQVCSAPWTSGCTGVAGSDWIGIQFSNPESVRSFQFNQPAGFQAAKLQLYSCPLNIKVNSSGVFTADGTTVFDPSVQCIPYQPRSLQGGVYSFGGVMKDPICNVAPQLTGAQALVAAGVSAADAGLSCFCNKQNALSSSFMWSSITTPAQQACSTWITNSQSMYGLTALSIISTLILNNLLNILFSYFDVWAKYPTASLLAESQFFNLFLAQFVNTALVTLVIAIRSYGSSGAGSRLANGAFDDLNTLWFMNIGGSLFFTFVMMVISSTCIMPPLNNAVLAPIFRKLGLQGVYIQEAMDEAVRFPEWMLAVRLGESLVVVYCLLMYASAMPFLYLLGTLYFTFAFWVDKWSLLRASRKPPQYSVTALSTALDLLPWVVLPHCLMGMGFYGQKDVFPSDFSPSLTQAAQWAGVDLTIYQMTKYVFDYQGSDMRTLWFRAFIKSRVLDVSRQAAWPMMFLFFLFVAYQLGRILVALIVKPAIPWLFEWIESKLDQSSGEDKTQWANARGFLEAKGAVFSYRMRNNPKYYPAHVALSFDSPADDALPAPDSNRRKSIKERIEAVNHYFNEAEERWERFESRLMDLIEVLVPRCIRKWLAGIDVDGIEGDITPSQTDKEAEAEEDQKFKLYKDTAEFKAFMEKAEMKESQDPKEQEAAGGVQIAGAAIDTQV